ETSYEFGSPQPQCPAVSTCVGSRIVPLHSLRMPPAVKVIATTRSNGLSKAGLSRSAALVGMGNAFGPVTCTFGPVCCALGPMISMLGPAITSPGTVGTAGPFGAGWAWTPTTKGCTVAEDWAGVCGTPGGATDRGARLGLQGLSRVPHSGFMISWPCARDTAATGAA